MGWKCTIFFTKTSKGTIIMILMCLCTHTGVDNEGKPRNVPDPRIKPTTSALYSIRIYDLWELNLYLVLFGFFRTLFRTQGVIR